MIVVLPLALVGVFTITSLANSQSTPLRASVQRVTSNTTPKRDRTRPYTFTTTGRVVPPGACPAGTPVTSGLPCLPPICPPPTNPGTIYQGPVYCVPPATTAVCSGKITVKFSRRNKGGGVFTISSREVSLKSDCTYRSRVSFRTRDRNRRGVLTVRVRFQGNQYLLPKNAPRRTVLAG
jgi:hypothetical protein